jgi:Uma2 family endonuclease
MYPLTFRKDLEYIFIDSEKLSVERFWRGKGQDWILRRYKRGDEVPSQSLGLSISMATIHSRVRFGVE